jgi:tyrosine-protein phosphatase SIW14
MGRHWKRLRWFVLAAAVGLGALFFYAGRPEAPPVGTAASRQTDLWLELIRKQGKQGYWIVVRGTHPGDQVVAAATAARLTHAAMLDLERNEVIEAVGRGVSVTPLRELLAQAMRVQLVKPRGYSAEKGRAAVVRARTRVGAGYDWLGTVGLQADRSYYCTELCADAYDARTQGWMPSGVLHPEQMARYGEVLFDSGMRDRSSEIAELDAQLRARLAKVLPDAKGVDYAAQVAPGLFRGGMPDDVGVQWLRARGIRTVINLRHYHGDSEGELVRAAGMRYERIPLESTDAPEPEQVKRFLAIVRDPNAQPVYVHCLHGVDRTGTMIAAYRMTVDGWSNSDALAEMEHFGAHEILHDLRRWVGTYRPGP